MVVVVLLPSVLLRGGRKLLLPPSPAVLVVARDSAAASAAAWMAAGSRAMSCGVTGSRNASLGGRLTCNRHHHVVVVVSAHNSQCMWRTAQGSERQTGRRANRQRACALTTT